MKSRIKATASVLALVIAMLISVFALASCDDANGKSVPIYKGMEISGSTATALAPGDISFTAQNNGLGNGAGHGNGNGLGHGNNPSDKEGGVGGDIAPEEEEVLPENPFDENAGEDLEEDVKDNIDVIGSGKDMYYTKQNKDIYVNIKIDNPDSYEILSFTFNGVKYSDYMFEYGSTLENIIIKVNVGDAIGVVEYTIDAMKYINENNEIKDVIMQGDKTVKAGVRTLNMVHSELENITVGTNSFEVDAVVFDQYNIITYFGGKSFALIYDGEKLVSFKEIKYPVNEETGEITGLANGHIRFDNLKTNTVYQFAVVSFFDNFDGNGFGPQIIHKQSFRTDSIVLFDNAAVGNERVDFELNWKSDWENKSLESLKLYHGDEFVKNADANLNYVDGLLSGRKYKLVAEYKNGDATESVFIEFTTYGKSEPNFDNREFWVNGNSIIGNYTPEDKDGTLISHKAELFIEDTKILEDADGDISFSNLDYDREYTVKLTYVYNINDGEGEKTVVVEEKYHTAPYIAVTGITVNNTSAIVTGGNLMLTVNIDNPMGALIKSVTVFGIESQVTGNQNTLLATVALPIDIEGGERVITIEKISVEKDGRGYEFAPLGSASANVFVNGMIKVEKAELLLNEDRTLEDFAVSGDKAYLRVYFDNETGYDITLICVNWREYSEFTKISDEVIEIEVPLTGGWSSFTVNSISYNNQYVNDVLHDIRVTSNAIVSPENAEPIYISTPDELAAAVANEKYRYYELTCDLDFSGVIWNPDSFRGILNGNGYAIKNLNVSKAATNSELSIGLFSVVSGVITDLEIENSVFWGSVSTTTSYGYGLYIGAICGKLEMGIIENCTVADSVTFIATNNTPDWSYVAGIAGMLRGEFDGISYAKFLNCENNADISISSNKSYAAGIAASGTVSGSLLIDGCVNNGDISAANAAGIFSYLSSHGSLTVTNCENTGNITAKDGDESAYDFYAGGIIGKLYADSGYVIIENCANSGSIKGSYAGGIAGALSSTVFKNCENSGSIESINERGNAGGIAGNISIDDNCIVSELKNSGSVKGHTGVGGIFGTMLITEAENVSQLYNIGEVTGNTSVGGICGNIYTTHSGVGDVAYISNLENGGKILGETRVGGIIGNLSNHTATLNLQFLVNTGVVKANGDYAGGIIGYADCYGDFKLSSAVNFASVVANEYAAGVMARCYAYADYTMEYLANSGDIVGGRRGRDIVSSFSSANSYIFVYDFPDYTEFLENSEFYSETMGFDSEIWNLENISLEDGIYPHLAIFTEG